MCVQGTQEPEFVLCLLQNAIECFLGFTETVVGGGSATAGAGAAGAAAGAINFKQCSGDGRGRNRKRKRLCAVIR